MVQRWPKLETLVLNTKLAPTHVSGYKSDIGITLADVLEFAQASPRLEIFKGHIDVSVRPPHIHLSGPYQLDCFSIGYSDICPEDVEDLSLLLGSRFPRFYKLGFMQDDETLMYLGDATEQDRVAWQTELKRRSDLWEHVWNNKSTG